MMLPFAHLRWKGQQCSNIDTIDMFAETREIEGRLISMRFINQIHSVSEELGSRAGRKRKIF